MIPKPLVKQSVHPPPDLGLGICQLGEETNIHIQSRIISFFEVASLIQAFLVSLDQYKALRLVSLNQ